MGQSFQETARQRYLLQLPRPDIPPENPLVVLVTGATSGIGRATALLLVALGHRVAALGRRDERLEELENDCEGLLGDILTIRADVTDGEGMLRSATAALTHFGQLDVLVANAGIGHRGAVVEADWDNVQTVLRTNIDGVLHSVRACVPAMRASGGGHILTVSSVLGPVPAPYSAIYSMSKSAIGSLTQALRMELQADNIWVTNLVLGQTHSEFAQQRLGHSGKVASKFPTMKPETVAKHIVKALERKKRTVIIRPIDRLIVVGGRFFPHLMDRILARVYG